MKKLKLLSLLAIVALLTVPANAANVPGRCTAANAAAYCATAPANAANVPGRCNAANAAYCATICNDASCTVASRYPGAWGRVTFPAFLRPDANANAANPDCAAPDCNTPAIPDSGASAPDSNVPAVPATPAPNTTPAPVSNTPAPASTETSGMSAYELEVVRLVNVERARYGLSALAADGELSRIARYKSQDMRDKGYFSHESPTYGSPFQMLKSFGVSYRAAGENIAYGYATPQKVVNAWMNSEGHRANILNASYTRLGVGYVASGDYWTQLFTG